MGHHRRQNTGWNRGVRGLIIKIRRGQILLEIPELASGNPQLQKAMNKIVKAEQKTIDKVDEKIGVSDNKLKLVRELKTKFSEVKESLNPFRTVNDFRELKGVSSDPSLVNVGSIDKSKAVPGSYEFEVLNLAKTNSVMTYGFPDRGRSEIGVGYISFKTPQGETRDVYINSENNTLDGAAAAINEANLGVKANVVNDGTDSDNPWRLVISGEKTGWKNDFEWPTFHMLDGDLDLDLEKIREGKSATFKFNGHALMADDNTLKDLLPGLSIDLKNAKPGQTVKIEVQPDIEKIQGKAKNFVDKLNAVLSFINNQNSLGAQSRKDPTKALGGDTSIQAIESRLRNLVQDTQSKMGNADVQRLRDVGLVFNRTGTLDFDANKFQAQLEKNFDAVASLMSGNSFLGGFAREMSDMVDGVIRRGDGMMSIREAGLQESTSRLQKEKEVKTTKAEAKIEKIKSQFARAESAIQQMQSAAQGLPQGGGGIIG